LAILYSTQPERVEDPFGDSHGEESQDENDGALDQDKKTPQETQDAQFQHMISSLIFPAFKKNFIPPKALIEKSGMVVQVAQVKDLYKVFERC
jgi:DNA mismatch repair protein MLH1